MFTESWWSRFWPERRRGPGKKRIFAVTVCAQPSGRCVASYTWESRMRQHQSKCKLLVGVLAGLVLSLALVPQARADSETLFKRLLKSTGWINCPQPDGGNSWGTCWVYDRDERLVITNKHVIDRAVTVTVDFPLYDRGQLLTSVPDYDARAPYRGKVVFFDERRDLA